MIKMYAIFARETLKQMKVEGKLAAQAGHAYLHAWWDAEERLSEEPYWILGDDEDYYRPTEYYRNCMSPYKHGDDARKIALVVNTVEELKELYDLYRPHMGATLVEDCGYTIFEQPTITAVGLGPITDEWLKHSKLKGLETLKNEINL